MHVGLSVFVQGIEPGVDDTEVYRRELALADQAEPAGFDSVWTAEHHFTRYHMVPSATQFLTWVAARTTKVQLGTMVVVLPWHDPVRVAEEAAMLDVMSGGRVVLGVGRGLGAVEFDGFRLEMAESRQRFIEYADALSNGLETGTVQYDGELYRQPPVAVHPAPLASFQGRIYASAVSPQSSEIMARLGFGIMIIAQKPWDAIAADIEAYNAVYRDVNAGAEPPGPILVGFVSVHEDRDEAQRIHDTYGVGYSRSAFGHYEFDNERLTRIPGYEYYGKMQKVIEKVGADAFNQNLTDLQIRGTPDEVVQQTVDRARSVGAAGVLSCLSFGGMPAEEAERNFSLYAREVLPRLKEIDTFRQVGRSAGDAVPA